MKLNSSAEEIINKVKEVTGKEISLIPDSSLKVIATLKTATADQSHHLILFNPSKSDLIDYTVSYQCGFILRLFENSPSNRFQFAGNNQKKHWVKTQISSNKKIRKMNLPDLAVGQFVNQIFGGLLTQLRSIPIGMRIDQWLWNDYPELREQQRKSLAKQQQENANALAPEIRAISPPLIFNANAAMNSAFAQFCDELFQMNFYVIPYRSAGFESVGENLLRISNKLSNSPENDVDLVNNWANELQLNNWFEWVPVNTN